MGTLTLSELREEVLSGLANRSDFTTAQLNRAINLQQTRIARVYTFEEMQNVQTFTFGFTSTPATDKTQTFSSIDASLDPKEIFSVRLIDATNSRKLIYKTPRAWDRQIAATEEYSTGRSTYYTVWNKKFEWWRVPDSGYSGVIRLSNWPTTLSSDSATSDLDRKDDVLIYLTLSYLNDLLEKEDSAKRYFGIAANLLRDSISEDMEKPDRELTPDWVSPRVRNDYWLDPLVSEMP